MKINIFSIFRNRPSFESVIKLAGGSAIGQALVLLSTPLITRIYGPTEMGVFGLFMVYVSFASVGVALRYDLAIVVARDKFEASVLLITSIAIAAPFVVLASAVLYGMIHFRVLGYAALPVWSVAVMLLTLLATGIFTSLRFWFVGRQRFGEIGLSLISQGAGRATIPILLGLMSSSWIGLLAGEVLGRMLGIARLAHGAWAEVQKTRTVLSAKDSRQVLRHYWKYPAIFLPSSIIDALATSLPLPIISSLFGVSAAGEYFLVYRLASAPAALISAGVADVLHAKLIEAARKNRSLVHLLIKDVIRKLVVTSFAIYLPIAIASPFLFVYVFGHSWEQAGTLMAIQSMASITGLVVSPLSRALTISKSPAVKFVPDIVRLIIPNASLWICYYFGMKFIPAMIIFSSLTALSEILYMTIIWYAVTDHRQISYQNS